VTGRPKLVIVLDHPTQHFSPWFRNVQRLGQVELTVLYQSAKGAEPFFDRDFAEHITWDVPLLDGYAFEVMPRRKTTPKFRFWADDNPVVAKRLDELNPDVVLVFGYARSSNWRAVIWAKRRKRPVLVFSDSSASRQVSSSRSIAKRIVVGAFYRFVDGALYVSSNNRDYHRRYGRKQLVLYPCRLPVDLERFAAVDRAVARVEIRERHGISSDAFVVLFAGKLVEHKRAK
jgi:glycosyltransferase involved in cell wall biosynthesis